MQLSSRHSQTLTLLLPISLVVSSQEKEEAERRRIDQIEADLQRKKRVDAIKRANQLMYEQTDKMKFLRGQQLYTDVIADREDQVAQKKKKEEDLKVEEQKWHDDMMKRLKESERREVRVARWRATEGVLSLN